MGVKCPSCRSHNTYRAHSDNLEWWQCRECDCRWIYEVLPAHWSCPALASALTAPLNAGVMIDAAEQIMRAGND